MGRLAQSYFIKAKELIEKVPLFDYHIHTSYTDGQNTVKEIVEEAMRIGLEKLIFTEHIELWFAKNENWFGLYVDEICYFQKKYAHLIDIKVGIEAPAIDFLGNIEITKEMDLKCDYILGAAHRYPEMEGRKVKDLSADEAIEMEYKTLMGLATNNKIDAIAHLGGTCLKYCSEFPTKYITQIIREATKNGIAIEINHEYNKPLSHFINICIEEDATVVLGSNAHKLSEVGAVYRAIKEINVC